MNPANSTACAPSDPVKALLRVAIQQLSLSDRTITDLGCVDGIQVA